MELCLAIMPRKRHRKRNKGGDGREFTEVCLKELETWKASFSTSLQKVLQGVELVEKLVWAKTARKSVGAAATSRVRREDIAALKALKETGENFLEEKVSGSLEAVARGYLLMDLSPFFETGLEGVGEIIQSFRAVTKEEFQAELSEFLKGETKGDGVRLFLKVGADVDGLVDGQSALLKAICTDSMKAVQMLVEDGHADLEVNAGDVSDRHGVTVPTRDTAVMAACRLGRWGMIPFLVEKGADVEALDAGGRKALQIACETVERQYVRPDRVADVGVIETLRALVTQTSDETLKCIKARVRARDRPLLHVFTEWEMEQLVELLLERGVEVDAVDVKGLTCLFHAASFRNLKLMQLLINRGADVNRQTPKGDSVLIDATRVPDMGMTAAVLEILLDRGADVNVRGQGGFTALHRAVVRGCVESARLLLERGADVNAQEDTDNAPLHLAVEKGFVEMVRLLVERGADVNRRNVHGDTALTLGVFVCTCQTFVGGSPMKSIVEILLNNGAEVNVRGGGGCTALQRAVEQTARKRRDRRGKIPNMDVVKLLLQQGADVNIRTGRKEMERDLVKPWSRELIDLLDAVAAAQTTA
uniref:Uncharacterized protein n=1 Tax=Chromera velia CCMP2878 TaxID=1169474 RepID=A0A0G4I0V5_9ALVE|eukprot:Cvel_10016.t1-p1 / transcript=Cvel_10016.t1 / gene=Cvel_10016 / organism=Chromera_velia_CCMP2878 / gene_product=Putative ankyrin repeat protein RF_0381, putative / transcript_product=Putative ankyrin repeat protein RF_0381, putative / location=Cvel_scaffold594:42336-44485(+) / protein_length=589 / sequence_SO=supercontig / SO=protein_coding / is_pseudo=false